MRKRTFKYVAIKLMVFLFTVPALSLAGDTPGGVQLLSKRTGAYTMVERSNWSRYDNGKYIGHVYRELRSSFSPDGNSHGDRASYRGTFYILEETLRDMRQSARPVDQLVTVRLEMTGDGGIHIENDPGYPPLRGFPVFPSGQIYPGTRWTAPGIRAVDPLNEDNPVLVPFIAEYEYRGTELYRDIPVHRVHARFASRYRQEEAFQEGQSFNRQSFSRLSGTHEVDILIQVSDGLPLMMRDNLDETYTFPDGRTTRFRGFTLSFGSTMVPLDRESLSATLADTLGVPDSTDSRPLEQDGRAQDRSAQDRPAQDKPALPASDSVPEGDQLAERNIELSSVPEGIRLSIRDLHFAPDSDRLLPGEEPRLNLIAQALRQIDGRTFLVEGHTAAVGRPSGELELSLQRAKRMVDELIARGISPDRFLYKGWGGEKPIGDNDTEDGRRLNRRVEITILE